MSVEQESVSGFKIADRRVSSRDEVEKQKIMQQEEISRMTGEAQDYAGIEREGLFSSGTAQGRAADEQKDTPELNFSSFIFSLWTSALIQLGEIDDPARKKKEKNLPAAKQTIDLIGMLQEKTKGNLTDQEQHTLNQLLFDLRMKYVKHV